jgi:hypothetical protein
VSDPTPGEVLVRAEYRCYHGTTLWHWYPVGKVPNKIHALGNNHACVFELVSTEEEEWPK